jgi:branched-subunit amino acid transport protein
MTETVEQTVEAAVQNPEVISPSYIVISILTMALVTYLVRMLPFAAIRRKVKSQFLLSFLYYVPYAVLSAMTIPGIFFSTGTEVTTASVISATVGFVAALVAAFFNRGLLVVAISACCGVLATELITMWLF